MSGRRDRSPEQQTSAECLAIGGTRHCRESSSSHPSGDSTPVYRVSPEPLRRDILDVQSLSGPAFGAQPASLALAVVPSLVTLF